MTAGLEVEVLAPGRASGLALVLAEPLSFWGGFDPVSGRIADRLHPDCGTILTDRILIMPSSRGSSSASSVLAEAIRAGTAPAGIILNARDAILTIGSLVAAKLYGRECPVVVVEDAADLRKIAGRARLEIVADRPGRGWLREIAP